MSRFLFKLRNNQIIEENFAGLTDSAFTLLVDQQAVSAPEILENKIILFENLTDATLPVDNLVINLLNQELDQIICCR